MKTLLLILAALPLLAQQPVQTPIPLSAAQSALLKADWDKWQADQKTIKDSISIMKLRVPLVCPNGVKETTTLGVAKMNQTPELVYVQRCPGIRQASKKAK